MNIFHKTEDLDVDGTISQEIVGPFLFSGSVAPEVVLADSVVDEKEAKTDIDKPFVVTNWIEIEEDENYISAVAIIGGDTVDNGALVNDIFVSMPGLNCELEGVKCSDRGTCAPGNYGCVCFTKQFIGEYCEVENKNYKASAAMLKLGAGAVAAIIGCTLILL